VAGNMCQAQPGIMLMGNPCGGMPGGLFICTAAAAAAAACR